jgi:hypothetical protein
MRHGKGISDEQVDQIAAKINNLSLPDVVRIIAALASEAGVPIIMAHLQNDETGEFTTPIREAKSNKKGFDLRFTSHGFPPEDVDAFIQSLTHAGDVDRVVAKSNGAVISPLNKSGDAEVDDEGDDAGDDEDSPETSSLLKKVLAAKNKMGEPRFSEMLMGFVTHKCKESVVEHYSKLISLGAFN